MAPLANLVNAAGWVFLISFRWVQQAFMYPAGQWFMNNVLAGTEEAFRSACRESFQTVKRVAGASSFWFVSLVSGSQFYRENRQNVRRQKAWQGFWHNEPQSTLNNLVDRETGGPHHKHLNGQKSGAILFCISGAYGTCLHDLQAKSRKLCRRSCLMCLWHPCAGTSEEISKEAFRPAPQKSSSQSSGSWWTRWTRGGRTKTAPPARSRGKATSGSSSPSRAANGRPTILKRNGSELFERAAGQSLRTTPCITPPQADMRMPGFCWHHEIHDCQAR